MEQRRFANEGARNPPKSAVAATLDRSGMTCEIKPSASMCIEELEEHELAYIASVVPGGTKNLQDVYSLSPLQEGMLFHHLLNQQGDTYILSVLFELRSRAQAGELAEVIQKFIDRHEILRSAALWETLRRPLQVVHRTATLPVEEVTLDPARPLPEQLEQLMKPGRQRFNLQLAPLLRLQVATDARCGKSYALLLVHHVVCDYRSLQIMVEGIVRLEYPEDRSISQSPYKNYVTEALADFGLAEAEKYFRAKLGDFDTPTAPFGIADAHRDGQNIEESRRLFDPALATRLRNYMQLAGVSAARLFHAAWALVIAHTSGRDEAVFGTVVLAGRQRSAREQNAIGMFVNTLPLRLQLNNVTALELVEQTHRQLAELLQHEQTPLHLAQSCSAVAGSEPLFTALLNFRHNRRSSAADFNTGIQVLALGEAWSNYVLSLTVDDTGDGYRLTTQADRSIGADRIAVYVQTAMCSLLGALQHAPNTPAQLLSVLPDAELHQILESFNTTKARYPKDKTIHELFEEQVARTPDVVALVYGDEALTYAELNERCNCLAQYLKDKGAGADRLVAIYLERSVEMIVAVLGVLKAGSAYVPLEPTYPGERLAFMLKDTAPCITLTQQHLKEKLFDAPAGKVVALDSDWDAIAKHESTSPHLAGTDARPDNLAYVIYTSGSTGQPKGVMVEHRGVLVLWRGLEEVYEAAACQNIALNAAINFDASVQQLIQLLSGRTLFVIPQEHRLDTVKLLDFLDVNHIDGIDCTPSQLRAWIDGGLLKNNGYRLRVVLVGGEPIDAALWRTLAENRDTQFFNVYGPTECTVEATVAHINGDAERPHIGRPMQNRRIYILNRHRQPVPVGTLGELYIGGEGLARGYLNRTELTEARFITAPMSARGQVRLYKTGDTGRWQPNGTIEFMGRNDDQVKIRGHRIELGEIESRLRDHPQVLSAAVIAIESSCGEKRLVGYVTRHEGRALSVPELRDHLRTMLPDYMIPGVLIILERMPLLPSGKLNRKELPAPDSESFSTRQYATPVGEVEELLTGIWQDLLGVHPIGRHDNFFELGGHSLLLVQVINRLRRLGFSIDVRQVLASQSLKDLARVLTREVVPPIAVLRLIPDQCQKIAPEMLPLLELTNRDIEVIVRAVPGGSANVQDIYPLSPMQEGILFHHVMNQQGGDIYVIPTLLRVSSRHLVDRLISALQAVVDRHDSLRTMVLWERLPNPVQVVCRRAEMMTEEVEIGQDSSLKTLLAEWLKPHRQKLDLRYAPLMQARIAADADDYWYVLLTMHHIVTDGESLRILISEIISHIEGRAQALPEYTPYRNYIAQGLAYARMHEAEKIFRPMLEGVVEPTAAFGISDIHGDGSQIEEFRQELDPTLAQRVRTIARHAGASAATLFHAAWGLVIAHTAGRDDVVFGTVILGRLQAGVNAQSTVGMFINTLPLRLQLAGMPAGKMVEQTRGRLIELLAHEQASLTVTQRCSGLDATTPLFTALLNYRHDTRDAEMDWSRANGIQMVECHARTNYPITLTVDDLGDRFLLTMQTDQRIGSERMTAFLQKSLESLLAALESAAETPALALEFMPDDERRFVVEQLNATHKDYPKGELVHELFEAQVCRNPTATALAHDAKSYTYEEINIKANQLAWFLREKGIHENQLVGICVERSFEMLVGVLGILKAGAAYVPLDPNYPLDRLQYMLEDAAPSALLTQKRLLQNFPGAKLETVALDQVLRTLDSYSADNPTIAENRSDVEPQLVYVIYTSGSTGRPKGVEMPHRAMANLIEWHREHISAARQTRVLQFAALSFDVAFQEIFSTLCTGGTLVLVDEWIRRDARALMRLLHDQRIDRLFLPPLMLQSLAEHFKTDGSISADLRDVITAGEQLRITPEIVDMFSSLHQCRLHNHYGPTETHVVTSLTLSGNPQHWPTLPSIGKPIANTQIYILDKQRRPTPLGAVGEIYIGGAGVSQGYLRRPELTAERFVPDPFSSDQQMRIYKTGDLGRWTIEGTIEYLGRNDDQVKIRGFRVELGEIEAHLQQYPDIRQAAVIQREDAPGEKRLVAYITTSDGIRQSAEELRTRMAASLPEYMIPSAFVSLNQFPLTPSGKLDRRMLPVPERDSYASRHYEAPQGEAEERLARIWRDVLQLEQVGRHDNFFELGGNSLTAMKVIVKISEKTGIHASLKTVFRSPRLHELAQSLETPQDEMCPTEFDEDGLSGIII